MATKFCAAVIVCAMVALAGARGQNTTSAPQQGQPTSGADPYAGNASPGTQAFPLAAPAGTDSNARNRVR